MFGFHAPSIQLGLLGQVYQLRPHGWWWAPLRSTDPISLVQELQARIEDLEEAVQQVGLDEAVLPIIKLGNHVFMQHEVKKVYFRSRKPSFVSVDFQ